MEISPNAHAILLLTVQFQKESGASAQKPLTPREYGRFARWLRERNVQPARLIEDGVACLGGDWTDKAITPERLSSLLGRGHALALSIERWLRSGLWVMVRSDPDYPWRLKKRLGDDSPAVLFGCGNRTLLNQGGLAVVGSRKAGDEDLIYSRELGVRAAVEGFSVVSGGARGVDEVAMMGSLEAEGTTVGVLADSLLRASSSAKYRRYIRGQQLTLVSATNPEARFHVGTAMQRNKYIYCLADGAVVVHCGTSGGTWEGAKENLKKGWVCTSVKTTQDSHAGNESLIEAGAQAVPTNVEEIQWDAILSGTRDRVCSVPIVDTPTPLTDEGSAQEDSDGLGKVTALRPQGTTTADSPIANETSETMEEANNEIDPDRSDEFLRISFYELFLTKTVDLCGQMARSREALAQELDLTKAQLDVWLKRAVSEGRLIKRSRPVRYEAKIEQGKLDV